MFCFLYRIGIFGVLATAFAAGSGCSTVRSYDDQFSSVYSAYRKGEIEESSDRLTEKRVQRKYRSNDRLLWTLEAGKLLHAANEFEESNRYLERAEEIVRDFEERPQLNVRSGAAQLGALATNPAALPYRGTYADKILINTYKALNFLALGDVQAARVEIRRSYERQRQALVENEAAIEEARKRAAAQGFSSRETYETPSLQRAAPVDPATASAYADFANPFTTFLSGLVYLADRDPAQAEVDFRILAGLPIPNSFVARELERIQKHLDGEGVLDRRRVYVIFENGLGPTMQEMRVEFLLPRIGYTGIAFPRLVPQPAPARGLQISAAPAGEFVVTEQIASLDQILATEFQTRMPAIVLRTLTSFMAKEIAAKQLTDELDVWGLLLGSLYKAVVNRADTRTWKTLGKEFQVAALDRPEGGKLILSLIGRNKNERMHRQEVVLPEGDFILVLVRTVSGNDLSVATQFLR